jgi:hypothetical protein
LTWPSFSIVRICIGRLKITHNNLYVFMAALALGLRILRSSAIIIWCSLRCLDHYCLMSWTMDYLCYYSFSTACAQHLLSVCCFFTVTKHERHC